MGTIEEGARGGREIYEQEAVGRNGWGREGKQEGKRWEGSHEWRQPGEGDRGDKSRESERERDTGGGEGRSSSVHGMPSGDIVANDSFATRSFL